MQFSLTTQFKLYAFNINMETAKTILEIIRLKSKYLDQIRTNKCYSRTSHEYTLNAKTNTSIN